jgi:hypothetical protein
VAGSRLRADDYEPLSGAGWRELHQTRALTVEERRMYDRQIGELSAELKMTRETMEKLEAKVDDLLAAKNKGLGILLAISALSAGIGALLPMVFSGFGHK